MQKYKSVFEKYPIYDNFAYNLDFDLLYFELTGTQFVFSDLGIYKSGEWHPYSEIKRKN
ncbi:MAG: DUF1896 domain-containing protein [Prevotellaceae bacterium]|nr:DUF1896 domain-containing protein [Prevotellaceae bacterium]